MNQSYGMPCQDSFDGVFGLGLSNTSAWVPTGSEVPVWPSGSTGQCVPSFKHSVFTSPMQSFLKDGKQTPGLQSKFGIYWSGEPGFGKAKMYVDAAATSNAYYTGGDVMVSSLSDTDYGLDVMTISKDGISAKITSSYIDVGSNALTVPLSFWTKLSDPKGMFYVTLGGNPPVSLQFNFTLLKENKWIAVSDQTDHVTLGLPLFHFYYTVMDVSSSKVSFVKVKETATTKAANTGSKGFAISGKEAWEYRDFPGTLAV